MLDVLAKTLFLFSLAAAFWGWGGLASRSLYGSNDTGWFYPVILGMAAVTVIGGAGNALGIANSPFLWVVCIIGWLLALLSMGKCKIDRTNLPWLVLLGGLSLAVAGLLASGLMPSQVFNFHDDLHTYLARPVRMLQTGSLYAGWLDVLGLDSLGGQALFHGLLLLGSPLEYVNGYDAVLCAALAVAMAGELAKRAGAPLIYAMTAMAALVLINPQTVNVSALYSGTVIIQGLLLAMLLWGDAMQDPDRRIPWGPSAAIGLLLATLVVFKVTFVVFAVLVFMFWATGSLLLFRNKGQAIQCVLVATGAGILSILPWFLLVRENLITAIVRLAGDETRQGGDGGAGSAGMRALLLNEESFYGGGYLDYAAVVALLLLAGLGALFLLWRHRGNGKFHHLVTLFAAGLAMVGTYLFNPYFTDVETAIRYSCPILLAVFPFAVAVAGRYLHDAEILPGKALGTSITGIIAAMTIIAVMVTLFGDTMKMRVAAITLRHSPISYQTGPGDARYCKYALGPESRNRIQRAQAATEQGAGILAWVSTPFHLDFRRNPVPGGSEPALLTPWLALPLTNGPDAFRDYLLEHGVRYIIWEKSGPGIRNPQEFIYELSSPVPLYRLAARQNIAFLKQLKNMNDRAAVVYDQDNIAVLDLMNSPS